ncbi:exonuclease [Aspergillus aurantiobrunneus]
MTAPAIKVVDTAEDIKDLLGHLTNLPKDPPSLYIDLEGINLSRHGTVSIMQIYHLPRNETYLVDTYTLGESAFTTPSTNGTTTLKTVLENPAIKKFFFDVRNDSDALYANFGVHLAGIEDIQLLELATRCFSKRHINGLAKCIVRDAGLTLAEKLECSAIKNKGKMLFAPEFGGAYEVFNVRPIPQGIIEYCAQDVCILPRLWQVYNGRLEKVWKEKVVVEVKNRVDVCLQVEYTGKEIEKALAPPGWEWRYYCWNMR